ncbi:hypothetical protein AB0O28_38440, partial [Microbispora sp. NPDC088329]|uniref:hypothetical protein n=1 Tax=Microbispora sp. NPDC088329 TaxID=3154869 RepID=UPI003430C93F
MVGVVVLVALVGDRVVGGVGGEGLGVDQHQKLGDDLLLQQRDQRIGLTYPQRPVITLRPGPGIGVQQHPQPGGRLTRQIKLPLQPTPFAGTDPQKPPPVIGPLITLVPI